MKKKQQQNKFLLLFHGIFPVISDNHHQITYQVYLNRHLTRPLNLFFFLGLEQIRRKKRRSSIKENNPNVNRKKEQEEKKPYDSQKQINNMHLY
jgi:hypothetical protein